MENKNFSKGEEMLKDLSFDKSQSFLNKKRKALMEPFDSIHLDLGDSLKVDSNFFDSKKKEEINKFIEEKTNITTLNEEKEELEENKVETNNIIELKEKKDLDCFALDLLEKNGEFQVKFSKKTNSTYILKIKEVDIEDDYYEQVKYAKRYGKYSSLKYSAPNNQFWIQRYYYFSKFDKGIMMDKES